MPTPEKEQEVALLEDKFERSTSLVFTDFRGLSAQEMVELRRLFRENDLEYRVIKNTLARLASQRVGLNIEQFLVGPTGVLISYDDSVRPFKLAVEAAKRFKQYEIKGGLIEGEIVEAAEAERIAKLPSREELLARLAFTFQAPIQKLAADLKAIINRLAIALAEVRKKKESGELPAGPAVEAQVEAPEAEATAEAEQPTAETQEPVSAEAEQEQPEAAAEAEDRKSTEGETESNEEEEEA
jgi:large subunit ribosomal protein L10